MKTRMIAVNAIIHPIKSAIIVLEIVSVVAADVSENFLTQLSSKYQSNESIKTAKLNGQDLSNFPDDTFDMVSTYSVLHHIPDYKSL